MNDDNLDGIPGMDDQASPTPGPPVQGDEDIKISNTGQRIRAIAVAILVLVGVVAAIIWFSNRQAELKRHEDTKLAFQAAHAKGYTSLWQTAQIDVKDLKTNTEFESRLKQIIGDDPVRYGKFVKTKCMPIIDSALPMYKKIEAPLAYSEKMENMVKAADELRAHWNAFAEGLLAFEGFIDGKKKLDKAANSWLGAQQSKDKKFTSKAYGYFKVLECLMPEAKIEDIKTDEISTAVQDSCQTDRAEWFRRAAFDCLPTLIEKPGAPDAAFFAAMTAARKSPKTDFNSVFGIEDCLKLSRNTYEEEMIAPLLNSWVEYLKAQNELLGAIKAEIENLN